MKLTKAMLLLNVNDVAWMVGWQHMVGLFFAVNVNL